ncbi:MAG: hypothetical protein ABL984_11655 [Pyrinomonadaceae bacterium]
MLYRTLILIVFLFSSIAAAQSPTPRPDGRPINPLADDNARFDRLRSIEKIAPKSGPTNHPLLDRKKGMYRKATDDEIRVLAVDAQHASRYESFLKQPGTGIVKLSSESSCVSTAEIIVATERCAALKMPGAGTSYSFRMESYRVPRLADIVLFNGMFGADAVLQQFALVDLGSVNIEDVTLDTNGLKYLVELMPVKDRASFAAFDAGIAKGVVVDGFVYRNGHAMRTGNSYALRSIAFRGKFPRSIDGVEYDEMDFDRRRDIIVAFHVVGKDSDGNPTIVWKRLKDAEAPKLESQR